MTITLNQTNPTGQTWTYKIPYADKILRVTSSSPYFLYQVTANELLIKAKLESQNGDTIVATDGTNTNTYVLNKQSSIIDTTEIYYGSSAEVPTTRENGTQIHATNEFTFTANNRYGWFALPIGVKLNDVLETLFFQSFKDMIQTVEKETYTIYYIDFAVLHETNLKVLIS